MRLPALFLSFTVVFLSKSAAANPGFPAEIPSYMKTTCSPPDCVLCHVSAGGQCGEINKPFGKWLVDAGLSCANGNVFTVNAIDSYLDEAKSTGLDSNCDGVPDYQQLQMCDFGTLEQDQCGVPHPDGGTVAPVENVAYGCSTSGVPAGGAALGVGLGLLLVGRRRHRSAVRT